MVAPRTFCIERSDQVFVVKLMDDPNTFVDDNVFNEVDGVIEDYLAAERKGVVIDFVELNYFNSIMLEALLRFWNRVREANSRMALCNLSSVGREILEISKLDSIWAIYESRDDAIRAIAD